jgi:hypothetical protein
LAVGRDDDDLGRSGKKKGTRGHARARHIALAGVAGRSAVGLLAFTVVHRFR